MRKFLVLFLTLALCLSAAPALADDAQTVTAQGTATVTVTPDMATFTIGVSTQDMAVTTAQSANAAAMQQVLESLKASGVAEEDLQTDSYNVSPVYDYQGDNYEQVLKGYSVTNTVQVTVRALDQLPTLLDAAIAAGANETYGVTFQSSQYDSAYEQALQAAVLDAQRKAALMAKALGRETGAVLYLSEDNDSYAYAASGKSYDYASSSVTPIESGSLSVTANVTAEVEMR
jgi:uncharacterized protein